MIRLRQETQAFPSISHSEDDDVALRKDAESLYKMSNDTNSIWRSNLGPPLLHLIHVSFWVHVRPHRTNLILSPITWLKVFMWFRPTPALCTSNQSSMSWRYLSEVFIIKLTERLHWPQPVSTFDNMMNHFREWLSLIGSSYSETVIVVWDYYQGYLRNSFVVLN